MKELTKQLNRLPDHIKEHLMFIGRFAGDTNVRAYCVGGFVRDLILGVSNFDLDIVIEGDGIDFAQKLSVKLSANLIIHKRFGTATLITENKAKIDFATARQETYEYPGSLPKVTFGSIKDDLSRRDFSINALAFSIMPGSFGQLMDFFSGVNDLKEKSIRVLHNLSFIDDPTRILRAIRFQERYGFKISAHTLKLIKEAVKDNMLSKVKPQRLRDEIILLLKEKHPVKCIKRLNDICGLTFIHPDLKIDYKKLILLNKVDKTYNWFKNSFPHKRRIELWIIYLIVLLSDLSARSLSKVASDFGFHRGEKLRLLSAKSDYDKIIRELKSFVLPSQLYRLLEPLSYEVMLFIMLKSSNATISKKIDNFLRNYNEVKISCKGEDLKKLSVSPGPRFKEILKELLYAKLDKKFRTKEDELVYLKSKIIR